jgi:Predicted membrane protein
MKKIKEMFLKLWKIARNPMIRVLPGQIAFFLVLSIFPILMLVGVISSFFSISMDTIIAAIADSFPKDVVNLLTPLLTGKVFDTNMGILMITGFFMASNGAHSIILASNTLYEFPHADVIRRRVKAVFIIILMVSLFIFTILVLAFGDIIMKHVLELVTSDKLADTIYKLFILLRWPFAMFIMFFNIKLIYTLAPDWKILSKYTTKGAVFTTVGWIVATMIYSYYATHFSNYDFFYGSLSSIVVLMIWVYALSYILVIGIAINVNVYQNVKEE